MNKPISNRFNAQELWQKDHDHFLHPWTHFDSFKKEGSLIITEGEGVFIKDINGKRYLDGLGGMWCVNVGYGRNELADAMAEQARLLPYTNTFVDMSNAPAAELAANLARIAPKGLNHVAYSTSGSCANDTAVRLAHFYQARRGEPSRRHVISRLNSYHGSTYLGISLGNRHGDRTPNFHYISDFIHHLSAPYPYRRPEGMSEDQFTDFLVGEFKTPHEGKSRFVTTRGRRDTESPDSVGARGAAHVLSDARGLGPSRKAPRRALHCRHCGSLSRFRRGDHGLFVRPSARKNEALRERIRAKNARKMDGARAPLPKERRRIRVLR